MNRKELSAALQQVQVQMIQHSRNYDGTKQLYDAACFAGDGKTADQYRQQLHATLDGVLDCAAQAMTLTRQLMLVQE